MGKIKIDGWEDRLSYAWRGMRGSLVLTGATFWLIFSGVVDGFDLASKLFGDKWPDRADSVRLSWIIISTVILIFVIKSCFAIAENSGRIAAINEGLTKDIKGYLEAFAQLHSVVHDTRDSLLIGGVFTKLLQLKEDELWDHFVKVVESQLGKLEKALRQMSGGECVVTLKLKGEDAFDPAKHEAGLVSVAYSPGTPLARKKESTVLPLNQGIAYKAMATCSVEYTNNASSDSSFWHKHGTGGKNADRYETVVAAPFCRDGEPTGVLCFDWKESNMYKEEYNELIAAFTDILNTAFHLHREAFSATILPSSTQSKEIE